MRTSREPVGGPVVEQRERLPAVGAAVGGHAPAGPSWDPAAAVAVPWPIQDGTAARGD